jgi:hypothetical protein
LQNPHVNREPKSTKVSAHHFIGGAAFNAIPKANHYFSLVRGAYLLSSLLAQKVKKMWNL